MREWLYHWTENLALYFIFLSVILQMIPDDRYKKYVRFFIGLLLIWIILSPIAQGIAQLGTIDQTALVQEMEDEWKTIVDTLTVEKG